MSNVVGFGIPVGKTKSRSRVEVAMHMALSGRKACPTCSTRDSDVYHQDNRCTRHNRRPDLLRDILEREA